MFSFSITFSASKHFSLSCFLSFSLECFQCRFSSCKQNEAVSFGFSGGFVHEESFFLLGIMNVVERNRSESTIDDLVSALSERLREGDRKPRTRTTTTTTTTTTTIHHNLLLRLIPLRSDSNLSPLVLTRCRFSLTTTLSLPFYFFNRCHHFLYKIICWNLTLTIKAKKNKYENQRIVGIRKENAGIVGTFNLNSFDYVPVLVICLVAEKV